MAAEHRTIGVTIAAAILAGVFGSAFVYAPHSCEGGLDLYFWTGAAALVLLAILPFVVRLGRSIPGSIGWAFGLLLAGSAVWVGGLAATNFRILCRLF